MVSRQFLFSQVVVHLMGPILELLSIFKNQDDGTGELDRRV